MRRALALAMALGSVACTRWPEHGAGGMAEIRVPARPECNTCLEYPDPSWDELNTQLQLVRGHLDTLVLRGADACLPAHVATARERQRRITRALHGGLPLDAQNDLIIQRDRLAELERRLDYIQNNGSCHVRGSAVGGMR